MTKDVTNLAEQSLDLLTLLPCFQFREVHFVAPISGSPCPCSNTNPPIFVRYVLTGNQSVPKHLRLEVPWTTYQGLDAYLSRYELLTAIFLHVSDR